MPLFVIAGLAILVCLQDLLTPRGHSEGEWQGALLNTAPLRFSSVTHGKLKL